MVALLVWFWITNLAILFGHQLNAERERRPVRKGEEEGRAANENRTRITSLEG